MLLASDRNSPLRPLFLKRRVNNESAATSPWRLNSFPTRSAMPVFTAVTPAPTTVLTTPPINTISSARNSSVAVFKPRERIFFPASDRLPSLISRQAPVASSHILSSRSPIRMASINPFTTDLKSSTDAVCGNSNMSSSKLSVSGLI